MDLIPRLKELEPPPIVVVLTNYPYPAYRQRAAEAGSDFFFDKSTEFHKVLTALTNGIEPARPSDPRDAADTGGDAHRPLGREQPRARLECGADDFLTKPPRALELLARVRSLLRMKHYTDQLERAEPVLLTLARSIQGRDPHLEAHCERPSVWGVELGRRLGLSEDELPLSTGGGSCTTSARSPCRMLSSSNGGP